VLSTTYHNDLVEIVFPLILKLESFNLYNATGQCVYNSTNIKGNKIVISKNILSKGIYIYQLLFDTGIELKNKLLIN